MKNSIKGKAKAKVAAKTGGIKGKVKAKVAAKCGRGKACAAVLMAAALCTAMCGCLGTTTPSRSQTLTFDRCTFNIRGGGADTNELARLEIGTQAMSIETSGTENQTVTPTQTTDVKPDINLNYAQGGGITNRGTGGSGGASGILESLTADSLKLLKSYVVGKKSGTVTLTKKDGTTVTADCKDGDCTFSDGTTVNAETCADCELPGWVEPDPVP